MNNKNKIIILMFVMILFSLTCVVNSSAKDIQGIQNGEIMIKVPCENNGSRCGVTAECSISIDFPNKSELVNLDAMENLNNGMFNYTLSSLYTKVIGCYPLTISCVENGISGVDAYCLQITPTGTGGELSGQTLTTKGYPAADGFFTILIWIVFITASIGCLITVFLTIAKLATGSETIYGVLISWGFYVLLIIANFLGKNFMLYTFIGDITDKLLTACLWTNGILPAIGFVISIFIRGFKKKNVLSIQEVGGFGR